MLKKLIIPAILVSILASACERKLFDYDPDAEDFEQMEVSQYFDWRTSTKITLNIEQMPQGVVNITSVDGSISYYKGFNKSLGMFFVNISVPSHINAIAINSQIVEINSNVINYHYIKTGPEFKSGETNYSMHFDGDNDRAEISVHSSLELTEEGSVEAWIYIDNLSAFSLYGGIIHKGEKKEQNDISYSLQLLPTQKFRLLLVNDATEIALESNQVLNLNEWYHVAGTWDQTGMKLYINGGLNAESDQSMIVRLTPYSRLIIGAKTNHEIAPYKRFPFAGNIDEVRIWNDLRTQAEILDNRNHSLNGDEAGLVGYWKGNEGSGLIIYDSSTNSNSGDLKDGVTFSTNVDYEIADADNDGVPDDEDDFPYNSDLAFVNYYPAINYSSLAFEDLWPGKGDYDFNDLIVDYKFSTYTNASNKVNKIEADIIIRALGGTLHNGFGFQLANSNVTESNITVTGYNIQENYITLNANGTESGQAKPTIIVCDDAFNVLIHPGTGSGINTVEDAPYVEPQTLQIVMTFTPNTYTENDINILGFNPFIIIGMERGKEVHLPNYEPTSLVDESYFGTIRDNSIPAQGRYYKTEDNYPWAIDITESFDYPIEKEEIAHGHLNFIGWAQSDGSENQDWYQDKDGYRNIEKIYKKQ